MARVVLVHGIGQQLKGPDQLLAEWMPALRDGLTRAGAGARADRADAAVAFYGDLFRPPGRTLGLADPPLTAADVDEGLEAQLLQAWWAEAASVDPAVVPPDTETLARAPRSIQGALRALSASQFFAKIALRSLVFDLKQVAGYLTDEALRGRVRARVAELVGPETAVVVGHSLGSVAAYETLCTLPRHPIRVLITVGSPLGIRNLVWDRLEPAPVDGLGAWPGGGELAWTNVADQGDVVALVKDLRPAFGPRVRCKVVHNGSHAHDVRPYLSAKETGDAIATALAG